MRMEALRQTNYVKSIVTAQGKMDLERKGKQSYQGWMCARLLAFSNGDLQALFDRSDGFYRRQLVLTTKEKPAGRVDDPDLAEKMKDVYKRQVYISVSPARQNRHSILSVKIALPYLSASILI